MRNKIVVISLSLAITAASTQIAMLAMAEENTVEAAGNSMGNSYMEEMDDSSDEATGQTSLEETEPTTESVTESVTEESESTADEKDSQIEETQPEAQGSFIEEITEIEIETSSEAESVTVTENAGVAVTSANFPDSIFLAYVEENFDKNADGYLSNDEIAEITTIAVTSYGISSLEGIEYFTNLTTLSCSGNSLTSLDISKNTALTSLNCSWNNLTTLNVSGAKKLTSLSCSRNDLTSLNVSSNTKLTSLTCNNNQLTSLDVSSCGCLTELYCQDNILESLTLKDADSLQYINCSGNSLASLDISGLSDLEELTCSSNALTSFTMGDNSSLTLLYIHENSLAELDCTEAPALVYLSCYTNKMASLDVSSCTDLYLLDCSENALESIDLGDNTSLVTLYIGDNSLTALDLSNNTALKYLYCYWNALASLDVSNCSKLVDIDCAEQTINASATETDDGWQVDLSSLVDNMDNVAAGDGASIYGDYLYIESEDIPESAAYTYTVSGGSVEVEMDVTVSITSVTRMPRELSVASITLESTSYTYDGNAKEPSVVLTEGSYTLIEGTDYSIAYENNVNAGTGSVVITGLGTYSGSLTESFTIMQADISTATVLAASGGTYDGTAKTPSVTVKCGSSTLTAGTDYTLAYNNNTNAGTATVTITGKGNYKGTASANFTISQCSINNASVALSSASYTYDGAAKKPGTTVVVGKRTLVNNTDYSLSYGNNVDAGIATVTVTGKGNYSGSCSKTFAINQTDISNASVNLASSSYTYDGNAKTPGVTVTWGGSALKATTDYTVSYTGNTNAGTAYVTVTGKGNFKGTKSVSFTILKASQTAAAKASSEVLYIGETTNITASGKGTITYTSSNTSVATVNNDGVVTAKKTGAVTITATASGNTNYNPSTASVRIVVNLKDSNITGLSNKSNGVNIIWDKVAGASGYRIYRSTSTTGTYTLLGTVGSSTTSYTDKKAKNGTKYVYKVIAYSGTLTNSCTAKTIVRLSGTSLTSAKNSASKKIVVKWKKSSSISGYQIQYSTSKTFAKGNKTVTVSKSKKNRTISGLKKGKTYYVRIRTYKKVNGKTYYSAWSSKKKVKISK